MLHSHVYENQFVTSSACIVDIFYRKTLETYRPAFFLLLPGQQSQRSVAEYSTRGLTAWPEAVTGTGLGAGVGRAGRAATSWPRLQLLHSVPQGALVHVTVAGNNSVIRRVLSH